MSRIGKKLITLPKGVTVTQQGDALKVKGPKGELTVPLPSSITMTQSDGTLTFARTDETKKVRALHGLTRALAQNCITGVTTGFTRKLEITGVGYKAEMRGKALVLALGYSHPIVFSPPEEIQIGVPAPTQVSITGIDKQLVGQIAANIRGFRPPEPYNGKGVKYEGEIIRRKAGKAAAK